MNPDLSPEGSPDNGDLGGSEHRRGRDRVSALFEPPARSTDERLNALAETIRSWDWRTERAEGGSPLPGATRSARTAPVRRNWALAGVGATVVVIGVVLAIAVGSSSVHTVAPIRPEQSSSSQAAAPSGDLSRIRAATVTATAAGTAVSSGFAKLQGVPTVASVSAVIDPYLAALQKYQSVMAGTRLPASVTPAARAVRAQVGLIISFLQTLAGSDPLSLGTWINNYYLHTAELQSAIIELQNVLPNPTVGA